MPSESSLLGNIDSRRFFFSCLLTFGRESFKPGLRSAVGIDYKESYSGSLGHFSVGHGEELSAPVGSGRPAGALSCSDSLPSQPQRGMCPSIAILRKALPICRSVWT